MSVGRVCIRDVDLAEPEESVQIAAQRMSSRNVGTLMVIDENSCPAGIVTDRDLAIRVVGKGLDALTTTVRDVMSTPPDYICEDTPIETALAHMRAGPHRRLAVVDVDDKLVGMISLDDILDLLSEEFNEIGRLVRHESPASLAKL